MPLLPNRSENWPGIFSFKLHFCPTLTSSADWICRVTVSLLRPDGWPPTFTMNGLPVKPQHTRMRNTTHLLTDAFLRRAYKCGLSKDLIRFHDLLRSCYHRCTKSFFGYDRLYSVTAILLELQLPSFNTLLYNYKFSFSMQFTCSGYAVVNYLVSIWM